MNYEDRLNIAIKGDTLAEFETLGGFRIARGYQRVVIGARGPYIEFTWKHMVHGNVIETDVPHRYFKEWHTPDGVRVYEQLERVDYADYLVGCIYVSPFKLVFVSRVRCCEELRELSSSKRAQQENLFDQGAP